MTEEITKSVFITERGIWTEHLPGETVGELLLRQGLYIDQAMRRQGPAPAASAGSWLFKRTIPEPTSKDKKIFSEEELTLASGSPARTKASGGMKVTIPVQDSQSIKVLDTFENRTHTAAPCRSDNGRHSRRYRYHDNSCLPGRSRHRNGPLAHHPAINPQTSFGADVISRISYTEDDPHKLSELQKGSNETDKFTYQTSLLKDRGRKPSEKT